MSGLEEAYERLKAEYGEARAKEALQRFLNDDDEGGPVTTKSIDELFEEAAAE